jgi:hypothetical protein
VGTQDLDIVGNSGVDTGTVLFELTQSGQGTALGVGGFGTGATALKIFQGAIHIPGAATSSNQAALIHTASACVGATSYSVVAHDMLDTDSNALVFVTARAGSSKGPFEVVFNSSIDGCAAGASKWAIHDKSGGAISGQFNVVIIKGGP